MSFSSAAHPSALSSGLVLAPFVERFVQGRRVALLGDATSRLASELVTRGARLVHVYDPDPARVAQAIAQGLPRSVTAAPLTEGDLGVRDHAFDLTIVPNLAFFLNPYALLGRVRQMTTQAGLAVVAVRCDDAARLQLGYYELYDAASLQFSTVKMVGQIPFDGFALVDFGVEDPEVSVDASFADAAAREPVSYVVVASERPVAIDGYTIVQIPTDASFVTHEAPTVAAGTSPENVDALRIDLTQIRARLEATAAELEAVREGRTAAEAQSYEARRRVADLEQELSLLQGQRNELSHALERARLEVAQASERAISSNDEAAKVAERATLDARRVGERLGADARAAAERALDEARQAAESAGLEAKNASTRAQELESTARDLADRGVRVERELVMAAARVKELEADLRTVVERAVALEAMTATETLRADRLDAELRRTAERLEKAERLESDTRRAAERAAIDARRALERAEAEARASAERASDKIDQLNRQLTELRTTPRGVSTDDHEAVRTQATTLATELADAKRQVGKVADLEAEVARLQEVAKDLSRLRELEREISRLAPLEHTAARVAPLEKEVTRLRDLEKQVARIPDLERAASAATKLRARAEDLGSLVDELQAKVADLEAQLSRRSSSTEREIDTLHEGHSAEIIAAEKALRERAQRIAVLEREVERRGTIVRELLGELEAARDASTDAAPVVPPARRDEAIASRDADIKALRGDLTRVLTENDALRLALQNERAARARAEIPRGDIESASVLQSQVEAARAQR